MNNNVILIHGLHGTAATSFPRLFLFFVIVSFCSLSPLSAQESLPLLLVTQGDELALENYKNLSVSIFSDLLEKQGIQTVAHPGISSGETVDTDNLLDEARRKAMVFLAINTLIVEADIISIHTEFLYTPDGAVLFQTEASGSLSLGLDRKLEFVAAQAADVVAEEIEVRSRESVVADQQILEEEHSEELVAVEAVALEAAVIETSEIVFDRDNQLSDEDTVLPEDAKSSEEKAGNPVRLMSSSLDIGPATFLPIGRYTDFIDVSAGGIVRYAMALAPTPLDFSLGLGGFWLHSTNPYTDLAAAFQILVEVGYRFQFGQSSWSLIPRLSGGILIHLASGSFNTLEDINNKTYVDQLYGLSLEVACEPWIGENGDARLGFYLRPGFFIFPNQEYAGMRVDVEAGVRIRMGKGRSSS